MHWRRPTRENDVDFSAELEELKASEGALRAQIEQADNTLTELTTNFFESTNVLSESQAECTTLSESVSSLRGELAKGKEMFLSFAALTDFAQLTVSHAQLREQSEEEIARLEFAISELQIERL